jgi:hypothetical protein
MRSQSLSAVEATEEVKDKWDACWPNDGFVGQLIDFEEDCKGKWV